MNTLSENDFFYSTDLGLAASLVSHGFFLNHLDKSNPQKVEFCFERVSQLDQAIQLYWANQLTVPALAYFNALKMLKNRIYSE